MARAPGAVLPFRMPYYRQPDPPAAYMVAVPPATQPTPHVGLLDSHEILVLHFTHEMIRIQRLAPLCSANEILALQGEWSLLAMRLDAIEAAIKSRLTQQAKAAGLTGT